MMSILNALYKMAWIGVLPSHFTFISNLEQNGNYPSRNLISTLALLKERQSWINLSN